MAAVTLKSKENYHLPEKRKMIVEAISWQVRMQSHIWSPPTDLYENDTAYIVRLEIAGMRCQDFRIRFENNYLTISGTRPDKPERRAYYQMEVRFGEFDSVVVIPGTVDIDKSVAEYEDGFLVVTLPKAAPSRDNTK